MEINWLNCQQLLSLVGKIIHKIHKNGYPIWHYWCPGSSISDKARNERYLRWQLGFVVIEEKFPFSFLFKSKSNRGAEAILAYRCVCCFFFFRRVFNEIVLVCIWRWQKGSTDYSYSMCLFVGEHGTWKYIILWEFLWALDTNFAWWISHVALYWRKRSWSACCFHRKWGKKKKP